MGFRALRVINEDRVQPGQGFGTHPHRDMEIISYVLQGGLQHRDSMGNGSVIRPGEVQRMSAGSGVTHSEFNASEEELVHFLQIWLVPAERGIKRSYEQKLFDRKEQTGRLRLVASPDGRDGSVTIHTDANLYAGLFDKGAAGELPLHKWRHAWVHVARGKARIDGNDLKAGDGAAMSQVPAVRIEGVDASEIQAEIGASGRGQQGRRSVMHSKPHQRSVRVPRRPHQVARDSSVGQEWGFPIKRILRSTTFSFRDPRGLSHRQIESNGPRSDAEDKAIQRHRTRVTRCTQRDHQ